MPYASAAPNAHPDFRCRVCGCDRYVTIEVQRSNGNWYRTPFFKCCGCSVMFEDPLDFAGLRAHVPGNENYAMNSSLPGSKPKMPPAPNPFAAGRKRYQG